MVGKDSGGQLDIVLICAKAGEVTKAVNAAPAAKKLGTKPAKHPTLVPADYHELLKASEVQRGTWWRTAD
jgi:hypothetical protein